MLPSRLLLLVASLVLASALPVDVEELPLAHAEAASAPLESSEFDALPLPRELQEAISTTSAKKDGFSAWAAAKRYFSGREHMKAKLTGSSPSSTMPKEFGIGFKHSKPHARTRKNSSHARLLSLSVCSDSH